jgi:beta-glucosidase
MRQITCGLVVLIALTLHPSAQNASQPSADIEKRVESLLSQMTLEEKIDMLGGENVFYIRAIPPLKIPAQKMADGPLGVRNYGPSTAYAAGIALAASWDTDLANRVGTMIGHDARARGVHFLLGPGVNIYRAPMNGRNFEYDGEDPFLAARTAVDPAVRPLAGRADAAWSDLRRRRLNFAARSRSGGRRAAGSRLVRLC